MELKLQVVAISRLSRRDEVLAQKVARLDQGLRALGEADKAHDDGRVVAVAQSGEFTQAPGEAEHAALQR